MIAIAFLSFEEITKFFLMLEKLQVNYAFIVSYS